MLSWPCGTTERPLRMAKICPPNGSLAGKPPMCEKSTGKLLAPFCREIHRRGEPVEVERLQERVQVDPLVKSLQRPAGTRRPFCRCSCTSWLIACSSLNQASMIGRTSSPEEPCATTVPRSRRAPSAIARRCGQIRGGWSIQVPVSFEASDLRERGQGSARVNAGKKSGETRSHDSLPCEQWQAASSPVPTEKAARKSASGKLLVKNRPDFGSTSHLATEPTCFRGRRSRWRDLDDSS